MSIDTLATALEREHREIDGGIEEYLAGLGSEHKTDSLRRALAGLRRHIYLEEKFLFPPLREAGMMMPILVMLREHGELWRSLDGIDALLGDDADDAAMAKACGELLALLDTHNSKEEPIIYSQADATLSPEAGSELSRFLEDGRMPAGWVCQNAQA